MGQSPLVDHFLIDSGVGLGSFQPKQTPSDLRVPGLHVGTIEICTYERRQFETTELINVFNKEVSAENLDYATCV